MAAYPTSPAFKSRVVPITSTNARIAESGKVRSYSLGEGDAYRIIVVHPVITSAELATIESFYATNKHADNTITPNDGNTYDCWFEGPIEVTEISAVFFTATVRLLAERQ